MSAYFYVALVLAFVSKVSGEGAGLGGNLGGSTYKNPYASKGKVECKGYLLYYASYVPFCHVLLPSVLDFIYRHATGEATQFGCLNDFWCDPALGLSSAGNDLLMMTQLSRALLPHHNAATVAYVPDHPQILLPDTGYGYCYVESAQGQLAVVQTNQLSWLYYHGTKGEKVGALVCQWFACEYRPKLTLSSDGPF